MSYQGHITNTDGAVTGVHPITVRLYSDPNGKHKLWEDTYTTDIKDGIFSVLLGTRNPLPPTHRLDRPIWLGVSIEAADELRPLTQFTAAPYALTVPDKSITKEKLSEDLQTLMTKPIGGQEKQWTGDNCFGCGNVSGATDVVAGGRNNTATAGWSVVGGGATNTVIDNGSAPGDYSSIVGGNSNDIIGGMYCFIGGGNSNYSQIADFTSIVGGQNHYIWSGYSFIGGGEGHTITSSGDNIYSSIVGGQANIIDYAYHSIIGGGLENLISRNVNNSVIGGGYNNYCHTDLSFIGGGSTNQISGSGDGRNTIGGGIGNTISNVVEATIGGGNFNTINLSGNAGTIAGGWFNTASANVSAILGGDHNTTLGVGSAIGGGAGNTANGEYSSIAGGQQNTSGRMTFVGGGFQNNTNTGLNIDQSATLGGSELRTSGQNQVVLGWRNLQLGNNHLLTNGPNDDRVFEIGSARFTGGNWVRNNAFEVSYNGHSIVTHTNGSSLPGGGGAPTVFQGATYIESPVYAWGAIDANGNAIGTSNFGISQVIPLWPTFTPTPGTYLVTLSPADPHGGSVPDITNASVTVTVLNNKVSDFIQAPPLPPEQMRSSGESPDLDPISDEEMQKLYGAPTKERETAEMRQMAQGGTAPIDPASVCGYATASQIGITILGTTYPRSFIVRTYSTVFSEGGCYQQPRAFYFKVTHR